jgi:hypothetical protein
MKNVAEKVRVANPSVPRKRSVLGVTFAERMVTAIGKSLLFY